MEAIHASGLLNPPEGLLDLAAFLAAPRPLTKADGSLAAAIIEERDQGR